MKRETKAQKIARLKAEYGELNKQVEELMRLRAILRDELFKLGARPQRNPISLVILGLLDSEAVEGPYKNTILTGIGLNLYARYLGDVMANPASKKAMKAARLKK